MRIWIVVADEREALFYSSLDAAGLEPGDDAAGQSADHGFQLALKITNAEVQPVKGSEGARSDAAQRDGARPGGSAADVPGPGHREPFARRIAEEIERARLAGTLDRVVLAAEPQILGLIRTALPAASREAVAAEVAKDLVRTEGRALLEHVPFEALAKSVLRI